MGDMADYALEQVLDHEEDIFRYRNGGMSDLEAYDLGIIDEHGYQYYSLRASSKACKHCGETNLVWIETQHGWRLANKSGAFHICSSYKQDMSIWKKKK